MCRGKMIRFFNDEERALVNEFCDLREREHVILETLKKGRSNDSIYKLDERIAEMREYMTFYRSCLESGDFRKGEDSEFYKRYGVCGGFGDGQRKTTDS